MIVENIAGADGTIGTGRVAHAAPDGYTLVLGTWNTHVTNAAVYALEYDVVKDFEPVVLLPDAPMVLIVKKTMPANNLNQFIAWLKAYPDKASMGTAGAGSPPDVLGRLLRKETGHSIWFGTLSRSRAGDAGCFGRTDRRDVPQHCGCIAASGFRQCESPWCDG